MIDKWKMELKTPNKERFDEKICEIMNYILDFVQLYKY